MQIAYDRVSSRPGLNQFWVRTAPSIFEANS